MTQPRTISDLVGVHLVAEAGAPADVLAYDGEVWGVSQQALQSSGSGADNPGTLLGIRGYLRPYTGPVAGPLAIAAEFVMSALISQPTKQAFLVIPGPEGWQRAASRSTYRTIGEGLITTNGLPAAQVLNMLTDLYNAAVAEAIERHARGYSVAGM